MPALLLALAVIAIGVAQHQTDWVIAFIAGCAIALVIELLQLYKALTKLWIVAAIIWICFRLDPVAYVIFVVSSEMFVFYINSLGWRH